MIDVIFPDRCGLFVVSFYMSASTEKFKEQLVANAITRILSHTKKREITQVRSTSRGCGID